MQKVAMLGLPEAVWASSENQAFPLGSDSNTCPQQGFPPDEQDWPLARANYTELLARPAAPSLLTAMRIPSSVCLHSLLTFILS